MRWPRRIKLCGYTIALLLGCQLVIYTLSPGVGRREKGTDDGGDSDALLHKNVRAARYAEERDPGCNPGNATLPQEVTSLIRQVVTEDIWWYIVKRVHELWPHWVKAAEELYRTSDKFSGRRIKQVLVVPGVLLGTDFSRNSSLLSGGPQGDLLQWADLIAALHILGHNVTLEKDFYQAGRGFRYDRYDWKPKDGCKIRNYDLVYADIIALKTFPDDVRKIIKNKLRIVDAYGTEAAYNEPLYALIHSLVSQYGRQNLHLKQFYTFYPHSPDNSFLGFVVPPGPQDEPGASSITKENIGVLYGKDANYFKDKYVMVGLLMEWMEVHATVNQSAVLPIGVQNHGVLPSDEYHALLRRAKFFIGMGLPLESTGVMEALHLGCIYINPKFEGEMVHILQKEGKPTSRKMTSQVPYLQQYVGEPLVITASTKNARNTMLWKAVMKAYEMPTKPFVPHEFTMTGFLERLNAYIEHQKFGEVAVDPWPPTWLLQTVLSKHTKSCTESCHSKGLICEPSFFTLLNNEPSFEKMNLKCASDHYVTEEDIHLPAFHTRDRKCLLQQTPILYSCAGGHEQLRRLCPCRPLHKLQTALCDGCY